MQRKQSRKVLSILLAIGLVVILLLTMWKKRKFGIFNRIIIRLSKYRELLPYLIAQAKFETDDFKSSVYRHDNNLFGMKGATHREQLGTKGTPASDGGAYQHYRSDTQSLRDMFLWLDYEKFPSHVDDVATYARELKNRGYYTADLSLYTSGLKRYL